MVVALLALIALSRLLLSIVLRNPFGYLAVCDFVSDPVSSEMGKHIVASNPHMPEHYSREVAQCHFGGY